MKRFRFAMALAFLLLPLAARAQLTTVTGTVTDPNGIPYANGTIFPSLVISGSPRFTATNLPYAPPSQAIGLSVAGSFTVNLADVTLLTPGGGTWNFHICSAAGTVQPSGGKGPVCFDLLGQTISGSSQSITSAISAVPPPALTFNGGGGTITNVIAGTGLNGGGSSGPVTLNLNTALPSNETATTQTAGDNSTLIATDAWVKLQGYTASAVTGSGTTGTIPLWTSSAALGNSVITQFASSGTNVEMQPTGTFGLDLLGTFPSSGSCAVGAPTIPSSISIGAGLGCSQLYMNPFYPGSMSSTGQTTGLFITNAGNLSSIAEVEGAVFLVESSHLVTWAVGVEADVAQESSTGATKQVGFLGYVNAGGNTATQQGIYLQVGAGGGSTTVTNNYGVFVDSPALVGSTLTNNYGIYIADQTVTGSGGTNSNPYGIYEVAGKNYLGGSLTLGNLASASAQCLQVNTAGLISGTGLTCGGGASIPTSTTGFALVYSSGSTPTIVGSGTFIDNVQTGGSGSQIGGPTTFNNTAFQLYGSVVPTGAFSCTGSIGFGFDTAANDSSNAPWWCISGSKYRLPVGGVITHTSTYTLVASDEGFWHRMNCSGACQIILPAAPPNNQWKVHIISTGGTLATVSLNGLQFNTGALPPPLVSDQAIEITTDGSNYFGDVPLTVAGGLIITPAASAVQIGTNPITVNGSSCTMGNSCTLGGVNAQTATYQVVAADFTACKTITVASGTFTITLVASGSQPANGQCLSVFNYGSGVVTIARSGQNINGAAANLTLNAGSASAPTSANIISDGANYFATLDEGTVGTVTSVALTVPSWLTVGGSPITNSGTLAVTATTAQTSHQVIGTCGAGTTFAPCALVIGDLPGTVVTSAAALASNALVLGGGSQASKTVTGFTTDGASILTLGVTGATGQLCIAGTTAGVTGCLTTLAGGLTLVFPTGTTTNPGLNFVSNNSNSGFIGNGAGGVEWVSSGTVSAIVGAAGFATINSDSFAFNRTGTRELGLDDETAATGSAVLGIGSTANGNEGGLLRSANAVRITAAVTLSGATAVVASWPLPAAAKTWAWQCAGSYSISAGTTPALTLQMNASQTPTSETGNAVISSIAASGTVTQIFQAGSATSTSSGVQTIFADGATITTLTNAPWSSSGTIQASATAGTFAIQAVLTGTGSPAGTINVGSTCWLY